MKQLKWFARIISVTALMALFLTAPAHAAAGTKVVGLEYAADTIRLYVRNAGAASDVQASVGQYPAAVESVLGLKEGQVSVKTLILVEDSAEISEDSRKQAESRLHELFSSGGEEEVFALATVGKNVTMLQDYTRDSAAMDQALSAVQYGDEPSSVADALYRFLSEHAGGGEANSLFRVVFLSTGGKESLSGYTQEELQSLLADSPVAISALGVWNDARDNGPELSSLFTLARSTGGDGWMLDDFSDGMLAQEMGEALGETMMITVRAPEQVMDGSPQTLSLQFSGESGTRSVHLDGVRFTAHPAENNVTPTDTAAPDVETAPVEDDDTASAESTEAVETVAPEVSESPLPAEETEEAGTDTSDSDSSSILTILLIAAGVVIAALIVYIVLKNNPNLGKKGDITRKTAEKKPQAGAERKPAPAHKEIDVTLVEDDEDWEEPLDQAEKDPEETQIISETVKIRLTDKRDPTINIIEELDSVLMIGRGDAADIVIREDTISRKHCEIVRDGEKFFVVNYSASNGTGVGKVQTKEIGKRLSLYPGDEIVMGDVTFVFSVVKGESKT